jgi:hypothetical protein
MPSAARDDAERRRREAEEQLARVEGEAAALRLRLAELEGKKRR